MRVLVIEDDTATAAYVVDGLQRNAAEYGHKRDDKNR